MASQDQSGKSDWECRRRCCSSRHVVEFKLLFALFDVDNSGTLTRGELEQLFRSASLNGSPIDDGKVTEYLALADTDGKPVLARSFDRCESVPL